MPDLTIEYMNQCDGEKCFKIGKYDVVLGDEHRDSICTCPAFKFSKDRPKNCKHIDEAWEKACTWHEQHSPEVQTEEGVCPVCGGPTRVVRVAV